MLELTPLDVLPLWALFLVTLVVMLAAADGGYRLGRYRRAQSAPGNEPTIGSIVAATLGLLAFMLAFTFGLAGSRYDTRRALIQGEVNAIGTTYLRADFLPGDLGPKVRALLRQYVDVRLAFREPNADIAALLHRSEALHNELWAEAVKAGKHKDRDSVLVGLFIASLNDVIDLHAKRVTAALHARIPTTIWALLYFVSIVAMASMGYLTGLAKSTRSAVGMGMIFCFVATMLLISDLDRPAEGVLRVNQQGMIDLRESIKGE